MADVVLFGNQVEFLKSVNTPEYDGNVSAVINPDLSKVSGIPTKYWKRGEGNIVEPMLDAEKAAVDSAEIQKLTTAKENFDIDAMTLAKALVRAGVITKNQLITAIKGV